MRLVLVRDIFFFDVKNHEVNEGDIYGIELNTTSGQIDMYINWVLNKTIDVEIKKESDYRFGISIGRFGDKIQILNQHEIKKPFYFN